jgi:hypothetical protein
MLTTFFIYLYYIYIAASGKYSYQCSACTKLKVSRKDDAPVKMQRSLYAPDDSKKILSTGRELILPAVCTKEALSVQIDTVRLNGQATTEMTETRVAMVITV